MILNYGKNQIALLIGGSTTNVPTYFIIGSGSGTTVSTDTALVHATDRQIFTSTSYPLNQKVTFQGDWNSVEMSGLEFREWGLITSGTGLTGSLWSKQGIPALTFDGTNELRIESNIEIF